MGRYVTARDVLVRRRWSRFLTPLVGDKGVSVAELDETFAARARRKGDGRSAIYAYRRGESTISSEKAYAIGEALHDCGLRWCSGPVALHAAGYLGDFVHTLAVIASDPDHERTLAPALAMFAPLANLHVATVDRRTALADGGFDPRVWCELARHVLERYTKAACGILQSDVVSRSLPSGSGDAVLLALEQFARAAGDFELSERSATAVLEEWAIERAQQGRGGVRFAVSSAAAALARARAQQLTRLHDRMERVDAAFDTFTVASNAVLATSEGRDRIIAGRSIADLISKHLKGEQYEGSSSPGSYRGNVVRSRRARARR